MTDKHDKLVGMATDAGAAHVKPSDGAELFEFERRDLAAFASAHVASLCADVEPVAIYHGRCVIDCGEHGHLDMQLLKMIPAGTALCTASTVAAITAQRDAALARVAELEKDAARWRFSMWYQQEHLKNPSLRCEAIDELYRSRVELSADNYTAAIDKAITSTPDYDAALTKGQP